MKKKNFKSLNLNKKAISNLNSQKINGGILWTLLWCKDDPVPQNPVPQNPMPDSFTCPVPATGINSSCNPCGC